MFYNFLLNIFSCAHQASRKFFVSTSSGWGWSNSVVPKNRGKWLWMFLFIIKISLFASHSSFPFSSANTNLLVLWTDTHFTRIAACHPSEHRQEEIKVSIGPLSPGLCLQIGQSEQVQDLSVGANFRIMVTLQPQNAEKCWWPELLTVAIMME